jgi:hypothetical protein
MGPLKTITVVVFISMSLNTRLAHAGMVYAGQGQGLTTAIEEKLRQFDGKMKEAEDLQQKVAVQYAILSPKVLAQRLLNLHKMHNELKAFMEDVENDARILESQVRNQPGSVKPEVVAEIRGRSDSRKRELQAFLEANTTAGASVTRLADGRILARLGPESPSFAANRLGSHIHRSPSLFPEERNILPSTTCLDCKSPSMEILSLSDNAEMTSLVRITEVVGTGSKWKDLDIQLSPDWRQIGVFRQDKNDSWTSEFWCLARERYERCPGPTNQAPPSRRMQESPGRE